MTAPAKYLNTPVPADIAVQWRTWAGVEWRQDQHYNQGNFYPSDQRHGVDIPDGLCHLHRMQWVTWRGKHFRGLVWPGPFPNRGFRSADGFYTRQQSLEDGWQQHRVWWDEKTISQMQQVEAMCLSGRSRQCAGNRRDSLAVAA